ncbi:serine hydrolase [Bifidobacterium boum]|uniref:serine hydrolase n=1 Tax=Bifidobacterium boum TaxID=78343 RepID=UPI003F8F8285
MPVPTPTPAAPTFTDSNGSGTVARASGKDKSRRIVVAVVACVVVIALIVAGALVWQSRNTKESQIRSQASASSASSNGSSTKSPAKKSKSPSAKSTESTSSDTASRVLDKQVMDAIVDMYNSGSGNAAVSVMTSDNLKSYSSDNASYSMSAAGLYLPPWLAYYDVVGGSPAGGYQSVLSSMDNGKANELIDRDGGMDMLNSWLNAHDYDETRFGHLYGDVNASENGYDNTTSSDDAAKMLTQLITKGEDGLLNYNVASDGVVVPDGATVHAHRGMGVGDAYDYYMVVSNGSKKVVVVVLTEGQAKEQAASLTSNVLKQVWQKMFVSGK